MNATACLPSSQPLRTRRFRFAIFFSAICPAPHASAGSGLECPTNDYFAVFYGTIGPPLAFCAHLRWSSRKTKRGDTRGFSTGHCCPFEHLTATFALYFVVRSACFRIETYLPTKIVTAAWKPANVPCTLIPIVFIRPHGVSKLLAIFSVINPLLSVLSESSRSLFIRVDRLPSSPHTYDWHIHCILSHCSAAYLFVSSAPNN